MHPQFFRFNRKIILAGLILLGLLGAGQAARAGRSTQVVEQISPLHPVFPLLDARGENVLATGSPVSAMQTCGSCHDVDFIASHSLHQQLGPDRMTSPDAAADAGALDGLEMNCFLCHTPGSNNPGRVQALESGDLEWATTATLLGSGIVEQTGDGYRYASRAFSPDLTLAQEYVRIQDPANANCGQCHTTVHTDLAEPLALPENSLDRWRGAATGQVISPQRLSDSGLNLAGKQELSRSFDVHAERNLECTGCHYSLNNPVYFQEAEDTRPEHLTFDPRRLELGEYLKQPDHRFARGEGGDGSADAAPENSMRTCESCHAMADTHTWLPYADRHAQAVSCQTCHIPKVYAPAFEQLDWTVVQPGGDPRVELRGQDANGLISGYEPALLQRQTGGETKVAPFNMVTSWYWVYGDPPQPVEQADLEKAWLDGEVYAREVLSALDTDRSGQLEAEELALDSREKAAVIAGRLAALGLQNPRIAGEIQPYSINHSVTTGDWATSDCRTCHSQASQLEQPFRVASYLPGGVLPEFADDPGVEIRGELYQAEDGQLYYQPATEEGGLYVLGKDAVGWIDLFGSLAFIGILLGVAAHGTLRFLASLRQPRPGSGLERVYMYGLYERLWHWLQTFTVLGLLFTGLVIHKPDTFGIFSFRGVVLVHNVLAGILLVNAGLSLFYHLVSGEIRQYIPRPAGFFDQAVVQALYYLRGIFKGEQHPFEKTPGKKLNPLQQITYFGLLNVLLPLQIATGALMWGVQRWPELAARLGGLPFLAPFHTLVAWLFASFIVGHVYLTTTGHTPLTGIQAMMMGWDELEANTPAEEAAEA